MTYTWNDGDEVQMLRARNLAGYSIRDDVPFGALLARLCDLVERTAPPDLPDEVEVQAIGEHRAGPLEWAEPPNQYAVRVRLNGHEFRFTCAHPDRPTGLVWAHRIADATPTLRQALEQCRDELQRAYDDGDAGELVLDGWHAALRAANAALGPA